MPDDPQVPVTPAPAEPVAPAPAPAEPAVAPAAAEGGRFVPLDRFNGVVAQKYDAIRQAEQATARAEELARQLAEFQARQQPQAASGSTPNAAAAPLTQAEIDRMANVRAEQIRFNERCTESVNAGRKAHTDFDASIAELRKVSTLADANGQPILPQTLIEAALETGRGHDVLYALGKDSNEADRIMSLASNPVRLAVEVSRFAQKLEAPVAPQTPVEPAVPQIVVNRGPQDPPPPIRPVVGNGSGLALKDMALDDPNLPIEEFMRRRNEEAGRSRRANGRFR